jgi:hypothetical protein
MTMDALSHFLRMAWSQRQFSPHWPPRFLSWRLWPPGRPRCPGGSRRLICCRPCAVRRKAEFACHTRLFVRPSSKQALFPRRRCTHARGVGLPSVLSASAFNYAKGKVYGVEFTTPYAAGGLTACGNVAWSEAQGKDINSAEFLFDPDKLTYAQNHWIYLDHDQG